MKKKNCLEIKDLEEKLACLEKKYQDLISALEIERTSGMISEEIGDMPDILNEREFILKQIELVKSQLKSKETILNHQNNFSGKVEIGSRVYLQNHVKSMDIYLVPEYESNPTEGYISVQSPLGKAILGKNRGEKVEVKLPVGNISYTIVEVS